MKRSINRLIILVISLLLVGCATLEKPNEKENESLDNNEVLVEGESSKDENTKLENEEKPADDIKPEKEPVYTSTTYTKIESITFKTFRKNDDSLDKGKEEVKTKGENGSKTSYYKITYKDGVKISDELIREEVTKKPINEVVHVGTKEALFNGKALGKSMVDMINDDRMKQGISPLIWSDKLYKGAAIRSDELLVKFSHTRPDGSAWHTVSDLAYGENIAFGYNTTKSAHDGFQNSPEHRSNNMNPNFSSVAISVSKSKNGSLHWAVLFGN